MNTLFTCSQILNSPLSLPAPRSSPATDNAVMGLQTWYGMPAYAKDGNVVCFFQSSHKFKARYATFGFSDKANLDEGTTWPVVYALKELTVALWTEFNLHGKCHRSKV